MPHDGGITLRTKLTVIGRVGGIALNLVDDAVISNVNQVATGVQAHLASGRNPASTFERVCGGIGRYHDVTLGFRTVPARMLVFAI